MKRSVLRILSFIILLAIIFSTFSICIYAEEASESESEVKVKNETESLSQDLHSEDLLSYSCYYDTALKTVNVKGTMNYDAFALYGNSTLLIYVIPSGKTESEIINDENSVPIAEAPVSITFAFSFKVKKIEERYYRYAVFIRSADGEYILTSEAQYAETDAKFLTADNKNSFKGLSGNYSSDISSVNSQITFIPVYLDLIYTDDSSGYIYQTNDTQVSFDKKYIDELDAQIRSLSLFGTNVYLQFLLRSGGIIPTYMSDGAEYALPDVFDSKTVIALHAVTNFLASRYSTKTYGNIKGIVLGKAWDNAPKYNSFENISFEKYASMCGHYAAIISNAARDVDSNLNVMLSFDGNGFWIEHKDNMTTSERFSAKMLLSELMKYFDASSFSGLRCLLLVESEETPLDITSADLTNGIDLDKKLAEDKFYIGKQNLISQYLNELSTEYKSASKYYSILWTPKKELRGNALCAAYAYAFYELWADTNVISFTAEFSQKAENSENLEDLLFVMKNIDSDRSFETTKNLLSFFGKESWVEVINNDEIPTYNQKTHYYADVLTKLPKNIKGEFCYFDFSKEFLTTGWATGSGASDLKIDYLLTGDKALKSNFFVGNKDFCDLIYIYEYAENISYTPYIKFNFEILSKQLSSLYEIKFVFHSSSATFESSAVIKANQEKEIILNMTKAKDFSLLDGVKISVRSLDDSVDSCTLSIKNITGYSKKYSDSKLNDFIKEERDKQKHINNSEEDVNLWIRISFVTVLILISGILGFVLLLIVQKNNRSRRKD